MAGCHIHSARIAAPYLDKSTALPVFASPAVSPIRNNNPSYSTLVLDRATNKVLDETVRSYQLQNYIFGVSNDAWFDIKGKELGLEIGRGNTDKLNKALTDLKMDDFGKFVGLNFGFDRFIRELFMARLFTSYISKHSDY